MSLVFRIVLLCVSLITIVFMLKRIRNAKVQIEDVIFWIIFSIMLLVLSIFPQIAYFFASLLGIYATVNFIFVFFIFILLVRQFTQTIKVSQLENKVKELTQEIAIQRTIEKEEKEKEK